MFSVEQLNRVLRLDYPRHKVVDWHPVHYHLIELNDFDADLASRFPDYLRQLQHFSETGVAYTGFGDGEVYAMFGVFDLWPGVSQAWLIPSRKISKKTMSFHRAALRFFDFYAAQMCTNRIQITVCIANVSAHKWAKRCYFKSEGIMRKYGPDGSDYEMFAKVF